MKNNIPYYQHYSDADQHPKFKMLRVKYGWAGEGKFWALNNRIALAENCLLDLSKKFNIASIADDLNFNVEDFEQFIEYLITDCELIQRKNGFITSDIIQDNYEKVAEKRKKNALSYKKRHSDNFRNIQTAESEIQTAEFIQSKVKKSKEKKSILNIDLLKQVVDYLNTKLSSKYKYQSKKTQDLINARFKEGFTFEDFKYVIDIKYKEWSSDPKQYMYLRPETLFSNKFEGYRNQKEKAEAKKINWLEDYAIEEDKNDK